MVASKAAARRVLGGLLVGGGSRRMGRAKALVEIGGTTLAERAAAALAPHVERVVLLGGGPVPPALAGLERLADASLGAGEALTGDALGPPGSTSEPAGFSGAVRLLAGGRPQTSAGRYGGRPPRGSESADRPGGGRGAGAGPLAALLAALRAEPASAWLLCPCDLPAVRAEAVGWLVGERRAERRAVIPRRAAGARPEPLLALYEPAIRPDVEALAAAGVRAPRLLAALPGVAVLVAPPGLADCWRDADRPEDLAAFAGGG